MLVFPGGDEPVYRLPTDKVKQEIWDALKAARLVWKGLREWPEDLAVTRAITPLWVAQSQDRDLGNTTSSVLNIDHCIDYTLAGKNHNFIILYFFLSSLLSGV